MFKLYSRNLPHLSFLNIGQLELINEIFRDNYDLCMALESEAYLTYALNLIQTHGFYH
jgi:hypothetical protein